MNREENQAPDRSSTQRPSETVLQEDPGCFATFRSLRGFALSTLALMMAFSVPLFELVHFARTSEFHSYILLIPLISVFLFWAKRGEIPMNSNPGGVRAMGSVLLTAGVVAVVTYWFVIRSRWKLTEDDYLALMISAFLLCFLGVCSLFWSQAALRAVAFPLGMLIFMVPIPTFAMAPIDSFLQRGSAVFAQIFFSLFGTPFMREGLAFQLPDITIQIAPECSGIQSSLVLVITGLLAAYLFLRTPWKRAFLVLFVVILGLIRNGFRVFVIGELCVHLGPQMIYSYIHRKGGPIFFALSLIPLFLLLLWLQRSEKKRERISAKASKTTHA
jgi:exosortase C (VPDSG-CTERM-specific)